MIIELEMGFNGDRVKVDWPAPLDDFHKYLRYRGDSYEWVSYEPGVAPASYLLRYAEIPSHDPAYWFAYWSASISVDDIRMDKKWGQPKCECGSESVFGEKTGHSHWCPKYRRV